jgi:hypothetical protein
MQRTVLVLAFSFALDGTPAASQGVPDASRPATQGQANLSRGFHA